MRVFARMSLGLGIICTATASWAAPILTGELIQPPPGEHCHGSSIAELPNGDLLAIWFQGAGERSADDVRINGSRLTKGASEWSPVFLMADTPNLPDCNPVLYLDSRGTLWQFWIRVVANRWEDSLLMCRRSSDYLGAGPPKWDWQDAITLVPDDTFPKILEAKLREAGVDSGMWGEYAPPYSRMLAEAARDKRKRQTGWMTRIHPIELASGRMLLPLYHDGFNISLTAISDDQGMTWTPSGPIAGTGPIQPTFAQKKDGTIIGYFRDSGGGPGRVQRAESADDGETWTVTRDTDLPNPSSSLEVVVLDDGDWVMIYNDKAGSRSDDGRHSLAVSISDDEGATWKWTRHLELDEPNVGSFSYPSMIQAADGSLHATYSHQVGGRGGTIKHVRFNKEWIQVGD